MTPSPRATPRRPRGLARVAALAVVGAAVIAGSTWIAVRADAPEDDAAAAEKRAIAEALDPMTQAGQDALRRAHFGRQHTPSPIIIPRQTIPLRFSHQLHLGMMDCVDCHDSVLSSLRARDVNLPPEATCLTCHDISTPDGDPPAACSTCHPGYTPEWLPDADRTETSQVLAHPPAVVFPEPHLKFNHKIHLDRGVDCVACHGDMSALDLATADNALPVMGTCIGCHDGKDAPDACSTCHLTEPDGRLRTTFAQGKLEPAGWYHQDAHDDDWITSHRLAASIGDGYCASCHTEKECVDCHNGVSKPLSVHPNNWVLTHASAARKNTPDCASCHRSQTFCVDCHQITQVAYEEPRQAPSTLRFHPEGWVDAAGRRSSNHHAFEAQRNIRACASCHTEDTCTQCHSTLTLGINPHPPGFVASGACDRMRSKNARACVKCHTPSSSAMSCR